VQSGNTPAPTAWPHNDLEAALELAAKSPDARPAFWKRLLSSDVIVPLTDDRTDQGDRIAFTSVQLLHVSLSPAHRHAQRPASEVFQPVGETGVALNPAGPYGKLFTAQELAFARAGLVERGDGRLEAVSSAKSILGRLALEPTELLASLSNVFDRLGTVREAFIAGVLFEAAGEHKPHPLIVIDSISPNQEVHQAISPSLSDWASINGVIDVIYVRDGGSFVESAMKHGGVFYSRTAVPSSRRVG
jgi:hypothetical protein